MRPPEDILIDVPALAASMAAPDDAPALLDVRWWLTPPGATPERSGRAEYTEGHLPGAVFVDLETALSGPPGVGGRHPLPDPTVLEQALRAAGVRGGQAVVVYDGGDGPAAARAWWTLRWAGLADVRVLSGGYPAWVAAGAPVTTVVPAYPGGDVVVHPGNLPVLDAAGAAELAAGGVLLDVRAGVRYRGEQEPIDPIAGHIPGATNLPDTELLNPDGRPQPAAALRERFAAAGITPGVRVGAYCGSGVAAARTLLALHLAGHTDAALYVGSWSDWITDPDRPIATGATP